MSTSEWPELTSETREFWDQNAAFWDEYIGEGNHFHNQLIRPAVERLLAIKPGEVVLDVACGNGNFSRRLATLGAEVVAIDFSKTFITQARKRTTNQADRITYRVIDATDRIQLLGLGENHFDAVVCNQAFMDMATLQPLFAALSSILKLQGRFVFSLAHPCFQSPGAIKMVEEEDCDGEIEVRHSIKTSTYITPTTYRGIGIRGQPVPTRYFHRPLSQLFQSCFDAGFVIDGLEEPVFESKPNEKRSLSWTNFGEIPPVLVARTRRMN